MSHHTCFNIFPFDPMITPDPKISLPIDWDNFQRQLQIICPDSKIRTGGHEGEKFLYLDIILEQAEPWNVITYLEDYSQFLVSVWPKSLAKKFILWYRGYIPSNYRLFSVIPEYSETSTELTTNLTVDDIEKMYPYFVPED